MPALLRTEDIRTRYMYLFDPEIWSLKLQRRVGSTTFDARVGGLEVGGEVSRARLHAVQRRIGNDELAGTTTGAAGVEDATDVRRAAEVTVAARDAASELHSSVASVVDEHHLTVTTAGVERLHVAVLRRHCARDRFVQFYVDV